MSSKPITLRVFEVTGSEFCVASDDGQKVFHEIEAAFKEKHPVNLSFQNVKTLTSAFLNAAVGQLYGSFSEGEIKDRLRVSDMAEEDIALLKRVVDNAKLYFSDPQKFKRAAKEALEEDENGDAN